MPKTRQQRLAEERAGHPPSPPQHLEDKPRALRRTRAKTPSDHEVTSSAAEVTPSAPEVTPNVPEVAGPVVPATQFAMPGEPQALLRIWVDVDPKDSGRPVGDAILQETIPSSRVPELVAFLKNNCNQEKDKEMVEAIPSENQTVNKPRKAKKRAFRRNPLHATSSIFKSQPVTTSLDTSTAGCIFSPQAGHPETPAETAPETVPVTAPESPRGSKWSIGNLFQPSSIKKFFGFSPLTTVPDSPESLLQTPTTTTTQTLTAVSPLATVPENHESLLQTPTTTTTQTPTAEPALTEPKSRRSSPNSARDARAKQRRHNDSIIKPVKPATTSKNESDKRSRARKASPAYGKTETTTVEEEQLSDIRPRDRAERETRQGESEHPTPAPTIRWPSRSLDRMNQNKRKRFDEPVAGPDRGTYGLGEADLSGNNEEYGVTKEQSGKIRRTSGSREFSSQVAVPKTPIPITNPTGTFKVPSPGDSDWSDSGSEEEEGNTAGLEDVTPSDNNNQEPALASPRSQRITPPTQSEAVRKARERLLKFKPRKPSKLIQSSRAYPSPLSIGEAAAQRGPGSQAPVQALPSTPSTTSFNAFEEWRQMAPPAVTAALDKMEVDNDMAGAAFERGLGDPDTGTSRRTTNRYNAFEEWSRTAPPIVVAVLQKMEVDNDIAGQAFESGLDNSTEI